jgi:hypothetical protein
LTRPGLEVKKEYTDSDKRLKRFTNKLMVSLKVINRLSCFIYEEMAGRDFSQVKVMFFYCLFNTTFV